MSYQLIYRPPRARDGHKVFEDEHGFVYLADYSGATPDRTDDGPLRVDRRVPVVLTLYQSHLVCIVNVTDRVGSEGKVWTSHGTGLFLRQRLRMKVERFDALNSLLASISAIELEAEAATGLTSAAA